MKIKILGQLSYQSFPETNDMIEVDDELLKQIGRTKCFDVYNKTIIDYIKPEKSLESKIKTLRAKREKECFPIINRGQLWYANLTTQQYNELQIWYKAWLDVTETLIPPTKPIWLK